MLMVFVALRLNSAKNLGHIKYSTRNSSTFQASLRPRMTTFRSTGQSAKVKSSISHVLDDGKPRDKDVLGLRPWRRGEPSFVAKSAVAQGKRIYMSGKSRRHTDDLQCLPGHRGKRGWKGRHCHSTWRRCGCACCVWPVAGNTPVKACRWRASLRLPSFTTPHA